MPNLNPNSTNYVHSYEPNTNDLTMAMQYDVLGRPILRTTLGPTAVDAFGRFRVSSPFTITLSNTVSVSASSRRRATAIHQLIDVCDIVVRETPVCFTRERK